MKPVFEALLELNKQMLMWGMDSHYSITMTKDDFFKFATFMDSEFKRAIVIPTVELKFFEEYKVAGPGGYITIRRGNERG